MRRRRCGVPPRIRLADRSDWLKPLLELLVDAVDDLQGDVARLGIAVERLEARQAFDWESLAPEPN